MTWHLQNAGHAVAEKRIRRLMRLMRVRRENSPRTVFRPSSLPIYQKPNSSRPAKAHKTYPYLLGGLRIDRSNQVWCADITYLHPWETGSQAKAGVGRWITFYNHQRPRAIRRETGPPDQFLILLKHGGQPPAVVYFKSIETDQQVQAAA